MSEREFEEFLKPFGLRHIWATGGNFAVLRIARPDPQDRRYPDGSEKPQYIRVRLPSGNTSRLLKDVDKAAAMDIARELIEKGSWSTPDPEDELLSTDEWYRNKDGELRIKVEHYGSENPQKYLDKARALLVIDPVQSAAHSNMYLALMASQGRR